MSKLSEETKLLIQNNKKIIQLNAIDIILKYSNMENLLNDVVKNGNPVIIGTHEEKYSYLRTLGLTFIDKCEISIKFPYYLINYMNDILKHLIVMSLANKDVISIGNKELIFDENIHFKITEMQAQNTIIDGVKIDKEIKLLELEIINLHTLKTKCSYCSSFITNKPIKCHICRKVQYCSNKCRRNDRKHNEYCLYVANGNCCMCDNKRCNSSSSSKCSCKKSI